MIEAAATQPWVGKIALAVATASVLGAGHTIISNKVDLARLQHQVVEIAEIKTDLRETAKILTQLSSDLAILVDRQQRQDRRKPNDASD